MQNNDYKIQILFAPLRNKDLISRKHFLEELEKEFETDNVVICNGNNNNNGLNHCFKDHTSLYPVLLRLAYECPFEDVRISCENILQKLENQGIRIPKRKSVGPSSFISVKECIQIDENNNEVRSLFVDAFVMNGRTSHTHQLLGYHVQYLSCFMQFEAHIMRSNGPLPLDWRYYLGILGAARHQCGILVEECEEKFLIENGDPKWLQGIENIPVKLQKLNSVNKILAHQPWLISEELIKDLLVGPQTERWSLSELIHAIVILVHFQTLSGFVFGCGINPEIDMRKGHSRRTPSSGEYSSGNEILTPTKLRAASFESKIQPGEEHGTTAGLFEKIQEAQREECDKSQDEDEEEERLRQFQEVETKELDDTGAEINSINSTIDGAYNRYLDDAVFHYEEFAKREKKNIEVFRAQDYNWQEHCFSFINRLYPEMGSLLDEKFKCTFELTYNTMGNSITNVDTSKFRLATWNYIHLVNGIYHDDYMYYEVNKLLEKSYKSYIKKVACFPELVTFFDYWDYYADLLPSEKVHINLLVLESRLQAILLYASRRIMNIMNKC